MIMRKLLFNSAVIGYGVCGVAYSTYKAPSIVNSIYRFEANTEIDMVLYVFGPAWCAMSIVATVTGWPIASYADYMQKKHNMIKDKKEIELTANRYSKRY